MVGYRLDAIQRNEHTKDYKDNKEDFKIAH